MLDIDATLEPIISDLAAGNRSTQNEVALVVMVRDMAEKNEKLEERITTIEAFLNID